MDMIITSSAFSDNGAIPKAYTCEGRDISPPLAWNGIPAVARSLVLIVDDPDGPDPQAPRMTWVHWVLYNLPVSVAGLPGTGYGGPCPPIGRHRYFHRLYALDVVLPDLGRPTRKTLEQAMKGHVVAEARLVGTYQKGC